MSTCRYCRHWEQFPQGRAKNEKDGICRLITDGKAPVWLDTYEGRVDVVTDPDFGCNQWEDNGHPRLIDAS